MAMQTPKLIEKTCLICGKIFTVTPHLAKRKVCSTACKAKLQFKPELHPVRVCPICQAEFTVRPQKPHQQYCSRACWAESRKPVTHVCVACGKEYKGANEHYCSLACRKAKIEKVCAVCGQLFYVTRSIAHKRHTCSRACGAARKAALHIAPWAGKTRSAETKRKVSEGRIKYFNGDPKNHWNYRNGPFAQKRGVNHVWIECRKQTRARYGYRCAVCGVEESALRANLSVHHIKPFRFFASSEEANQPANLIAVCQSCHMKLEHGTISLLVANLPT